MEPTPALESIPARLDISDGRSVYIEPKRSPDSHQIIVKSSQDQSPNLTVYKIPNKSDKRVYMAFCFELKQQKYFPVVEKNSSTNEISFKIMPSEPKRFTKRFLFQWSKWNGAYGSLCSVAEPSQYLNVHKQTVTLSPTPDLGFRVQFLNYKNFNISMPCVQNCDIEEGCKRQVRYALRRQALQFEATRGVQKTIKKKKSRF